jgi:hypothetical protein
VIFARPKNLRHGTMGFTNQYASQILAKLLWRDI